MRSLAPSAAWMDRAECRVHPNRAASFFPTGSRNNFDTEGALNALAQCRVCPVVAECHQYRLNSKPRPTGVWGGRLYVESDKQGRVPAIVTKEFFVF